MAFKSLTKNQLVSDAMVVDNSVMMRWLFKDGSESDLRYAQKVLGHIEAHKPPVIVPYIWVYEASFVVNYYVKKDIISYETGMNHLDSLFDLCSVIRGEEIPSILFGFSNTHGLSSYDAAYVQLSLQQACVLATLDKKIVSASGRLNLTIYS